MPDMQTTKGRDVTNSLWVVLAATVHVGFSTLLRSGSQNLPCRSLRRRGKPLRPVLASGVAATVHVSFATRLHGDGQFCRADHCGVAVAASSARAINIQTRTKVAMQGVKTDKGAGSSNSFMWTAPSGSRHAAR